MICGLGERVSDSISVAGMTAQADLTNRNPGPALASWETAVRAKCLEKGLSRRIKGLKDAKSQSFWQSAPS
jgi:hypothetical protein